MHGVLYFRESISNEYMGQLRGTYVGTYGRNPLLYPSPRRLDQEFRCTPHYKHKVTSSLE